MKTIEVLAPAGSIDAFYAAIAGGANAIYLSGKSFGARAFATNFTLDELKEIIPYAHLRSVKVYITINTIINDSEYIELDAYLKELQELKVDAVIVQDIGVIKYIKTNFKNIVVHGSTQMDVLSKEELLTSYKLGCDRVILGREYSLEKLKEDYNYLKENKLVDYLELEVFVHGAMCYSESGRCLFSFSHGGRSGNKGACAQCCRKKYSIYEDGKLLVNNEPILSMKDLYTLDHLNEIVESNIIDSIKIEGRMKSPSYVFLTTYLYRKALDLALKGKKYIPSNDELNSLQTIFNRTYTKGYLFKDFNNNLVTNGFVNHQGILIGNVEKVYNGSFSFKTNYELHLHDSLRINDSGIYITSLIVNKKNVTFASKGSIVLIETDKKIRIKDEIRLTQSKYLDDEINKKIKDYSYKRKINFVLKANVNEKISLSYNIDKTSIKGVIESDVLEYSDNYIGDDRIKEQLSKLGHSIFELNNLLILSDASSYIKVSLLNDLRRKAVEEASFKIIDSYIIKPINDYSFNKRIDNIKSNDILINAIVENNYQFDLCKSLGFNNVYYSKDVNRCSNSILKNNIGYPNDGILSLYNNIISTKSINVCEDLGYKEVILSPEVDISHLYKINSNIDVGFLVYGKYDLMISKHCPIGKYYGSNNKHCGNCSKHTYTMKDEKNNEYLLHFENNECVFKILADKPHYRFNEIKKAINLGVNSIYFIFTDESNEEIINYKKRIDNEL